MDALSVHGMGSFHPGFRQRRMRLNGSRELRGGQFRLDSRNGRGDQFRGMRADGRRAQKLVGIRIRNPFYETSIASRPVHPAICPASLP